MRALPVIAALALLLPLATALPTPATCGRECRIVATDTGYDGVVTTIASGSHVVWRSADNTHRTRDVGLTAGAAACFDVVSPGGEDSPAVRFDLVGTQLVATVEGESVPCGTAVATPVGATVSYFCTLHPTMRGALVVTAA